MKTYRALPAAFFAVLLILPSFLHAIKPEERQDQSQLERLISQLPVEKRRLFDDTMKRTDRQNRKLLEEKHRLEAELIALLEAPEFDQRTYLDKSAKLGRLRAKMHANMEDAIAMVAAQFTLEERKILVKTHTFWQMHGEHERWSHDDDGESNHPPAAD